MSDVKVVLDEAIIGMGKDEAIAMIKEAGFYHRIVAEEGETFIVTMDYSPMRFNLEILNGKVTTVSKG